MSTNKMKTFSFFCRFGISSSLNLLFFVSFLLFPPESGNFLPKRQKKAADRQSISDKITKPRVQDFRSRIESEIFRFAGSTPITFTLTI